MGPKKSRAASGPAPDDLEGRLRGICMALPEVTEKLSHSAPSWFVRKQFVMLWADGHHQDEFPHMWCAAPAGAQEEMVRSESDRFFRPPYVGHRGWIGYRFDRGTIDWDEVAAICADAYRTVAPKKLAALLDADADD
jgi:hypothetical protein